MEGGTQKLIQGEGGVLKLSRGEQTKCCEGGIRFLSGTVGNEHVKIYDKINYFLFIENIIMPLHSKI
jgi:hypothetical protein